jgi:hypothetical protein
MSSKEPRIGSKSFLRNNLHETERLKENSKFTEGASLEGIILHKKVSSKSSHNANSPYQKVFLPEIHGHCFPDPVLENGAYTATAAGDRAAHIAQGIPEIVAVETDPNTSFASEAGSTLSLVHHVNSENRNNRTPNGKVPKTNQLRGDQSTIRAAGNKAPYAAFQSGNIQSSTAGAFSGGSGNPMQLPENTPEDVKRLAGSYDAEDSIPNKSQHAPGLAICHTEIVPYAKAFIYRCWTEKEISIRINSTYRSPAHQKRLRDEWDSGTAKYKEDHAKPALAGSSWHNTGMAFDFNPTLKSGVTLMKATDKGTWQNSGVPAIGESVGMRWGGHFPTNYDPIHFDLGNTYDNKFKGDLVKKAIASGVEANRITVASISTVSST